MNHEETNILSIQNFHIFLSCSDLSHLKDQFVVPPPQSVDVPDMPLRRPRRPRGPPGLRGRGLKEAETESRQGRSTGGHSKPLQHDKHQWERQCKIFEYLFFVQCLRFLFSVYLRLFNLFGSLLSLHNSSIFFLPRQEVRIFVEILNSN